MRVWFGGVSVKEREAIIGSGRIAETARPLPILVADPLELAAHLVLRPNLLASRQSAGAGRSHDDGRVNRRPDAIHGCGVGKCRGALPGQVSNGSQGRQGCSAREHAEAATKRNSTGKRSDFECRLADG